MNLNELRNQYQHISSINFSEHEDGMIHINVCNAHASGSICLYGAHVMSFTPAGEEDILWMSTESYRKKGKPLRGGVPLCWPWFGAHPQDESLPAHGLARLADWEFNSASETLESTIVELKLTSGDYSKKYWSNDFELLYRVSIGKELKLELTTTNTGSADFSIAEALHTYFNISDISNIRVSGFDGCAYTDTLTCTEEVQQGDITFNAETDRIYHDPAPESVIHDPGKSRKIINLRSNSRSAVMWNPWIAKSQRMPDFGDREYPGMLCVETANVRKNALTIKPGATHSMSAMISSIKQ
ncbi:MAG: D-hexose-6-phosphate mutarotase [Victivallales bacterium]|nr:D-hexose-6-phosphate mutarotase [Victivallales bacterium]